MSTFEVHLIQEFETYQKVSKLVRNGKTLLDQFQADVQRDKNIAGEYDELIATLKDVANNKDVPESRYKKLRMSGKLKYPCFEAKTRELRLYIFREHNTGQIIVFGGNSSLPPSRKIIKN